MGERWEQTPPPRHRTGMFLQGGHSHWPTHQALANWNSNFKLTLNLTWGAVDINKGVLLECDGLVWLVGGRCGDSRLADHLNLRAVLVLSHFLRDVDAAPSEGGESRGALGLSGRGGAGVGGPGVPLHRGGARADEGQAVDILVKVKSEMRVIYTCMHEPQEPTEIKVVPNSDRAVY